MCRVNFNRLFMDIVFTWQVFTEVNVAKTVMVMMMNCFCMKLAYRKNTMGFCKAILVASIMSCDSDQSDH